MLSMQNLSKREITILIVGIIFVSAFLVVHFGIEPAFEKRDRLKRSIVEKQAALKDMAVLKQEFESVSNRFDTQAQILKTRKKGFSLFAFLDAQIQHSGVKEKVAYMKPGTQKVTGSEYALSIVKLKLKQVYLKELIDFIHRVEGSGNGVSIASLSLIKAGREKDRLDVVIETQTVMDPEKG